MSQQTYLAICWNCLGEFDAPAAVWCSCNPKNPTKLCPFCFQCFCEASETYKKEFWRDAPQRLRDELHTLSRSRDRLGDILIRSHRITTPQLLEALMEQRHSGRRLGEILVEQRQVSTQDIAEALRNQGAQALTDTAGAAYASRPVWEKSEPAAIIEYILSLAASKGASDVQLEPTEDAVLVKYRIDGFSFRLDPLPKRFQADVNQKIFEAFRLDPSARDSPQTARSRARLAETDFDLVAQTLPTPHGPNTTIKLINRSTFLKDFTALGLEIEDRVRLLEELRSSFGLILVSSPVFNGARTTAYSILSFLVQAEREVVSLECPIQWPIAGARQVDVGEPRGMENMLRSVIAVRPEVIVLSQIPDAATALLAAQLATSILVVAVMPAPSAPQAVGSLISLGVPPALVAEPLAAVLCQRLLRQVCRVCQEPTPLPAAQTLAHLGLSPEETSALEIVRGKGCPTCNKVGYRGRRAIFELVTGSPEVKTAVRNGFTTDELAAIAAGSGTIPLRNRCLELVRAGTTTFDEFARLRL